MGKSRKKTTSTSTHPYKFDLVCVHWLDTHSDTDVTDVEDDSLKPTPLITCGFLLKKTKKYVRVVAETGEDGWCRGRTVIPMKIVQKIEVILKSRKAGGNSSEPPAS